MTETKQVLASVFGRWTPPGEPVPLITALKSTWYCPACGKQDMWQAADEGEDYYHQCSVICLSCGHDMCCVGKVPSK